MKDEECRGIQHRENYNFKEEDDDLIYPVARLVTDIHKKIGNIAVINSGCFHPHFSDVFVIVLIIKQYELRYDQKTL